jgi:hypothetical protein
LTDERFRIYDSFLLLKTFPLTAPKDPIPAITKDDGPE